MQSAIPTVDVTEGEVTAATAAAHQIGHNHTTTPTTNNTMPTRPRLAVTDELGNKYVMIYSTSSSKSLDKSNITNPNPLQTATLLPIPNNPHRGRHQSVSSLIPINSFMHTPTPSPSHQIGSTTNQQLHPLQQQQQRMQQTLLASKSFLHGGKSRSTLGGDAGGGWQWQSKQKK